MMEQKSEYDPTIIRRLQYQNKLVSHRSQGPIDIDPSRSKLYLRKSISEPSTPRKVAIANISFKQDTKNRTTSAGKIFDDDTEIDYNYAVPSIINEEKEEETKEMDLEINPNNVLISIATNNSKQSRDRQRIH